MTKKLKIMTTERLKYIFAQIADKENLFTGYATPWIFEDDRIYATDGNLLLCLENTEGRDKAFTDNGAVHPNVKRFIPPFDGDFKANHYIKLESLENFDGYCDLAGTSITDRNAKKAAKILRLFGMKGAVFGKTDHNRIIFEIIDSDNVTGMLLCVDERKESNTTLLFHDTILRPMGAKLYDALINEERGEKYFQKCLEQDKKEQEEYEKENFTVFEVTLTRSRTICVKAETEAEAKNIALNNAYYIDFDNDFDVDGCEESCKFDLCDSYDHYFDRNGKRDWDADLR